MLLKTHTFTFGILRVTGLGKSARSFSSMYFQMTSRMAAFVTSSEPSSLTESAGLFCDMAGDWNLGDDEKNYS